SSYARAMIELRADVELKDNIMAAMLKIIEEGYYTCNIRVEYERKPPSPSTAPIIGKINKIKILIIDGKAILVDNKGKHVRKDDNDNEEEVASVDNKMANFLAKDDGYGTQSLLEQWKYSHDDYEYVPYDDDLYDGQEIPEMLQAFCDNLDIRVRGRKKK
nr:hypothetical protein [Tanacetum cinerariifolium]